MKRDVITPASRDAMDDEARRLAEWHAYHSEKRIGQQWMQLNLLDGLGAQRVLEVGPYLGFVTALLDNAGYDVTTLDLFPPPFERPARPFIEADLTTLQSDTIAGFEAILCCETLEHLTREQADAALVTFHRSGARYLIVSVPYEGPQMGLAIYANAFTWRFSLSLKKFKMMKTFRPDADPWGHKWELGHRGLLLRGWEAALRNAGWCIRQRAFTHPCRSVFHLCERTGTAAA
ncbi:MAG: hypothetical protein O3B22_08840 [Proteobacteria bacterium]|nr:hypothetical protein [Pseudomonadota bacterium]